MRRFHGLVACSCLCAAASAQPFIRDLEVLRDSLPIVIEHAHPGSLLAPLNAHCVCLRIPAGLEGKVLVELLEVSPNGFASFYGYARDGRIRSCFKSEAVSLEKGVIHFEGRPASRMTLRRPVDARFR